MPDAQRQERLQSLTDEERAQLRWQWRYWARPEQLAPDGDWRTSLVLSGRGWGKRRTGAEWIRQQAASRQEARMVLVG